MSRLTCKVSLLLVPLLFSSVASGNTWIQGNITEIYISTLGNGSDAIYVKGTFSTGCAEGGFLILGTDTYFKETYATLLAAKLSGATVKYLHSYCHSSGYARGNGYSISG